ncbi:hypothetical protein P691DRAFT_806511 [Macrolepiota fuliginosa MF-IS2]|uniref:Uncharacterized protein n=1 Tax=Macrolepiota fuliginosa MF-IS2 TaxID=1400762 RepID=A0A9P5XJ32_9AGAR|nr:hypothetical protein P691DRAFT_806511 [Macrolepiota fuliginosa MF-IS2]
MRPPSIPFIITVGSCPTIPDTWPISDLDPSINSHSFHSSQYMAPPNNSNSPGTPQSIDPSELHPRTCSVMCACAYVYPNCSGHFIAIDVNRGVRALPAPLPPHI